MQKNDEYTLQVRKILRYIGGWGIFVIFSALISGKGFLLPGFLLGFSASVLYYVMMCRRVKKSADLPASRAVNYMRFGWLLRLAFVLAALVIAFKIPGLDFRAAVIGLFSLQIVIFFEAASIVAAGFWERCKK